MLIIAIVAIVSVGCAKKSTVTRLNNELAQKDQEIQRLQGELSTQKRMNEDLQIELMDLTEENSVLLEINDGLTHITLEGSATFASARAALTPASQNVLDRVWSVVGNYPDRWILVEGHADNQPINRDFMWKYQSNWELSSARAHSVLHYLLQAHRAEPGRIKVVGYGDQHPVADNESREGRQANRRVVITIGSRRDIEIRERSVSELSSSSGPDRNM
jgi:chemotaxis protein MotB